MDERKEQEKKATESLKVDSVVIVEAAKSEEKRKKDEKSSELAKTINKLGLAQIRKETDLVDEE